MTVDRLVALGERLLRGKLFAFGYRRLFIDDGERLGLYRRRLASNLGLYLQLAFLVVSILSSRQLRMADRSCRPE